MEMRHMGLQEGDLWDPETELEITAGLKPVSQEII